MIADTVNALGIYAVIAAMFALSAFLLWFDD